MVKFIILFVLLTTGLFSFSQDKVRYDSLLTDTFFKKNVYQYPLGLYIDDKGVLRDMIGKRARGWKKANRKQKITSETIVIDSSGNSYSATSFSTTSTKAFLIGDTLVIDFVFIPGFHYEVWAAKIYKGEINSILKEAPPEDPRAYDSLGNIKYDSADVHPFTKEKITLNKRNYSKGDLLMARINFYMHHQYYTGYIKCKVE